MVNADLIFDLVLWFENTEFLWNKGEWCAKALAKKIKKGLAPELNYLANSSTVKTIARETIRDYSKRINEVKLDKENRAALEMRIAERILDYADEMSGFELSL